MKEPESKTMFYVLVGLAILGICLDLFVIFYLFKHFFG